MKTKCKNKLKEINAEVQALQKDLIAASRQRPRSMSFSDKDQAPSSLKRMSNGTLPSSIPMEQDGDGDGESFVGFSLEDPLLESCRSKSFQLSLKVLSNGHVREWDGTTPKNGNVGQTKGTNGRG
jgi:hypothetical protein